MNDPLMEKSPQKEQNPNPPKPVSFMLSSPDEFPPTYVFDGSSPATIVIMSKLILTYVIIN